MLKVIDTHAHLDELEDLESALAKAKEVGVAAIIAVGSSQQSNEKVIEISQQYPLVYSALGLHPWELGSLEPVQVLQSLRFIEENMKGVVAIGEIGLDYDKRVVKVAPKARQKEILKRLLALAKEYRKPVPIHSRYAWKACFAMVKEPGI